MQETKRIFNHHAYSVRATLYQRRFKAVLRLVPSATKSFWVLSAITIKPHQKMQEAQRIFVDETVQINIAYIHTSSESLVEPVQMRILARAFIYMHMKNIFYASSPTS